MPSGTSTTEQTIDEICPRLRADVAQLMPCTRPGHLPLVAVGNHRLDSMHVRAKAPQFDLLALARLDSQGIRVHPFVRGHVG